MFEGSGLRRAIVLVVSAKVAAIILFFDAAGLDPFELPKGLLSRAFEWALAGLLLAAILRHGHRIVPRTPLHFFVAAFVIANLVSAVFAESPYVALFGERDRYLGLTFVGDMAVLYLAVAVAFRGARDWAAVLGAAGAAGAISLGYALMQFAGQDPLHWALDAQRRPFGTLGHPDTFGQLLALAFGVALGVAVGAAPRDRTTRIAAGIAAFVVLGGIGIVATRAAAVGVAAALAAVPIVVLRTRPVTRTGLARSAAIGALVLVAMAGLVLASPLGTRLRATVEGQAVADRVAIYENAVSAFRDRPLVGWGPNGFAAAYPHYRQAREAYLQGISTIHSSAHDWLLEAAASTGILGAGALLALIGATTVALWRSGPGRLPAVVPPLLIGSAAYWADGLLSPGSIAVDWFPWVAAGAAAAVSGTLLPEEDGARADRTRHQVAYALAAIGVVLAFPAFNANQEALAAQLAVSAGNAAVAIPRAESAVAGDAGRARYWSILGAADQLAQRWRPAAEAHAESVARAPYVATYWVNLASARAGQAVAGDDVPTARAGAFDAARRAVAVDPNEPVPHATLARVAAEFGDQPLAFAEITRAIALYAAEPEFDRVAANIAAQTTDPGAARTFLGGVLAYKDSATLRIGLARADVRMGDRDAARENARRALQLEPANTDALALLASLGG